MIAIGVGYALGWIAMSGVCIGMFMKSGHDGLGLSANEWVFSFLAGAVWPIMLTLGIGVAIGGLIKAESD